MTSIPQMPTVSPLSSPQSHTTILTIYRNHATEMVGINQPNPMMLQCPAAVWKRCIFVENATMCQNMHLYRNSNMAHSFQAS